MEPRTYTLLAPETAIERADRERTEHRAACDACIAGLGCPTGDDLDRRLTEAASGELPWPDSTLRES